jgi:hypothetical protein
MPVIAAATNLNTAKGHPKKEALTNTESTPVCGVLIKKPTVAPLLAPSFFRPIPVGMTPHEHNGSGTPMATDFRTPETPFNFFRAKAFGRTTCSNPESIIPNSNHGDSSHKMCHIENRKAISMS